MDAYGDDGDGEHQGVHVDGSVGHHYLCQHRVVAPQVSVEEHRGQGGDEQIEVSPIAPGACLADPFELNLVFVAILGEKGEVAVGADLPYEGLEVGLHGSLGVLGFHGSDCVSRGVEVKVAVVNDEVSLDGVLDLRVGDPICGHSL